MVDELRAARELKEEERGSNREADTRRGGTHQMKPTVRYYEDMGTTATEGQRAGYLDTVGEWRGIASDAMDAYDELNPTVKAAKKARDNYEIGDYDSYKSKFSDTLWSSSNDKGKSNYMTVNVMNGNKKEGTYKVDRSYVRNLLDTGAWNIAFFGNGRANIDVKNKFGQIRGNEIHTGFGQRQSAVKQDISKVAGGLANKEIATRTANYGVLDDAYSTYAGVQDSYKKGAKRYENLETEYNKILSEDYKERSQNVRDTWESFAAEGGVKRVKI